MGDWLAVWVGIEPWWGPEALVLLVLVDQDELGADPGRLLECTVW